MTAVRSGRRLAVVALLLAGTVAPALAHALAPADVAALLAMARTLVERDAWGPAREQAEAAARLAAALGARRLQGEALGLLGQVADGQGKADEAAQHYRAAAEIVAELHDARLEGWLAAAEAVGHWRRGEYPRALELLDRALAIQRAAGDGSGEARTLIRIGRVYFKQGRYPEADHVHRQALERCREIGDLSCQAEALEDLGDVATELATFGRAVDLFEQSRSLRAELGDTAAESRLETVIAVVYLRQGGLIEAHRRCLRAVALAERAGDGMTRAVALFHFGVVELACGREEGGVALLGAALDLFVAGGDPRSAAWCHDRLGHSLLRTGRAEAALDHFSRAIAIREAIEDARNLAGSLEDAGGALEALGRLPEALAEYRRSYALGERIELPYVAGTLGRIGKVLARQGDASGALENGQAGLDRALALGNPELTWRAHFNLALIERRLDRRDGALASLRRALATIEALKAGLAGGEDRGGGFLDDKQAVFGEAVSLLVELDRPAEALEVAERARARAFLDNLALPGNSGGGPHDQPAAAPAGLAARTPGHRGLVVEYFCTEDRLFIFVSRGDGQVRALALPLGAAELTREVARAREALGADALDSAWRATSRSAGNDTHVPAGRSQLDATAALRRLFDVLIGSIEPLLAGDAGRPLLVVPHGPIFLVPFAALRDRDGRYLIEGRAVALAPALGALSAPPDRLVPPRRRRPPAALLVGDPLTPPLPELGTLPALHGAAAEVAGIARLLPAGRALVLTGERATELAVRELAPAAPWLHFATHGILRDDGPLAGGLVLAAGGGQDGLLTAREVMSLSLHADLVVLSACNTGIGRVSGEGVEGLSRAFLMAGASTVVVSLWPVEDEVAAFQMIQLYRNLLRGGAGRAEALRSAQLATIAALRDGRLPSANGHPLAEDPRLWAPFVLLGSGE